MSLKRERVGLLVKLVRGIFTNNDTTEETEETETTENPELSTVDNQPAEPMYWESDKISSSNNNQHQVDLFLGNALQRIPDATEEPVKESQYKYAKLHLFNLPEYDLQLKNEYQIAVTDPPKAGTGISSSGRDAGVVAGIVVAVISGVLILGALIAVVLYKHYVHRNVTSMNFDNPVYRKTTEDQFALEKNGYAPGSKLYPSTVGEEAREPLNTPGTNEYV